MKKFKSMLLTMLALVGVCSCSDKEDDIQGIQEMQKTPEVVEEGPDYLVMFYSVGGGDLDKPIISNIYQALDVGSSDKVKMTVQYKLSADKQQLYPDFDGTRRLDLDDNKHLVGTMKNAVQDYPLMRNPESEFPNLFAQLKSERIADALYDLSKSDALADFITWSMKKHPNAKRTILILNNHGSGWQLELDNKVTTRAIMQDDNTNTIMSLSSVVEGVKRSAGKVDLLYTDACLMSMYENLYGYANCANYLLAAVEITPGAGGNYSKLINDLKNTGTSYAELEASMHSYADYLVSSEWWTSQNFLSIGYGGNYHDIALYDLTKLDRLTGVFKKVIDTMVDKFTSSESVEPTVERPRLGKEFSGYINYAFTNCQIAFVNKSFPSGYIPKSLISYIAADLEMGYSNIRMLPLVQWMKYANTDNARMAHENHPEDWERLQRYLIMYSTASFSITDALRILDNSLTEVGAKNNPFKQLRAEMIAALKEVGYISCTIGDEKPGIDQAYELCSPGITIVPFNEEYYDNKYNTFLNEIPTHQEALRLYQQTDFDKQLGWNRMLQLVEIFPNLFSNPARINVGRETWE